MKNQIVFLSACLVFGFIGSMLANKICYSAFALSEDKVQDESIRQNENKVENEYKAKQFVLYIRT